MQNGNATPTFEAMQHYARNASADVFSGPLTPRYSHDLTAMLARATTSTGLIYSCNPNNPSASLTPRQDLQSFLRKLSTSTFVVIDETYHHYAGRSGCIAHRLIIRWTILR